MRTTILTHNLQGFFAVLAATLLTAAGCQSEDTPGPLDPVQSFEEAARAADGEFSSSTFELNPRLCDIDRSGHVDFCDRSALRGRSHGKSQAGLLRFWSRGCSPHVSLDNFSWTTHTQTLMPLTAIGGNTTDVLVTSWQKPNWPHTAAILQKDKENWLQTDTGAYDSLFGVWSGRHHNFAIGSNGTVLQGTKDAQGQMIWTPMPIRNDTLGVFDPDSRFRPTLRGIYGIDRGGSNSIDRGGSNSTPKVLVVGDKGTLLSLNRDDNTGQLGWDYINSPVQTDLYGIFGVGGTDFIIVGEGGLALTAHGSPSDNTYTFSQDQLPVANGVAMRGIFGVGGTDFMGGNQDFIAIGDNSTILKGHSGNWSHMAVSNFPNDVTLRGIFGVGGTDFIVVGDNSTILHYTNGQWAQAPSPVLGENLTAVFGVRKDSVYAAGENGSIFYLAPNSCAD